MCATSKHSKQSEKRYFGRRVLKGQTATEIRWDGWSYNFTVSWRRPLEASKQGSVLRASPPAGGQTLNQSSWWSTDDCNSPAISLWINKSSREMDPPPTHRGPKVHLNVCRSSWLQWDCPLTIRRHKASSKQIDLSSTDNTSLWQLDGPNKQQVRSRCVLSHCVRPFNWRIECRPSVGFVHHKRLVSRGNGDGQSC